MNDIIIIGYSRKFINAIKNKYNNKKIHIFHWRKLVRKKINKNVVIFVCGFDYDSLSSDLNIFLHNNVFKIIKFIKRFKKIKKIYYINTFSKKKLNTFSRYNYAKNLLGYELQSNFINVQIVSIPTIVRNNKPLIHGNMFSKIIFYILIKLKLIETIEIQNISQLFNSSMKKNKIKKIHGSYLELPRNVFIDRLLRFIYG